MTKIISETEAERRFESAIRAAATLRDDEDLADEIEEAGLESWAEAKGYEIQNPSQKWRKQPMSLKAKVEELEEVNDALSQEVFELRARLDSINQLSGENDDESEDDDEFVDDDESEDEDESDEEETEPIQNGKKRARIVIYR